VIITDHYLLATVSFYVNSALRLAGEEKEESGEKKSPVQVILYGHHTFNVQQGLECTEL